MFVKVTPLLFFLLGASLLTGCTGRLILGGFPPALSWDLINAAIIARYEIKTDFKNES